MQKQFNVPMPDGSMFPVDAPDGATEEQARAYALQEWEKEQKRNEMITGGLQSVGNGLLFGFHDEASAVLAGLADTTGRGFTESYEDELQKVRKAREAFESSGAGAQVMGLAATIGGGLVTSQGIYRALQYLSSQGVNLATRLAQSPAAQAAMEGLVWGLGESESPVTPENPTGGPTATGWIPDAAGKAATGAALGAGLAKGGEMLGTAMDVVPRQAKLAKEMLLGNRTAEEAGGSLEELNALGGMPDPWAMYANVNPKAAGTGASIANPKKADELVEAVEAQRRQQPELVENVTRTITDTPNTRQAEADALLAAKRQEAKATYDPLKGGVIAPTDDMRRALATDQGQEAAALALKLMNNDRTMSGLPPMEMDQAVQNFDFWHRVQKKLRRIGKQGENPLTGIDADLAKQANEIHGKVMDEIFTTQGQLGLDYQQATKRYAENMGVIDALADSAKFGSLDVGEVQKMVGGMSPDEREAFKVGVVNDLLKKALRTGDEGDQARKLIGNEALRRNLRIVLGDDVFGRLDKALTRLRALPETNQEVLRGSQTQPRQARTELLMNPVDIVEPSANPLNWISRWAKAQGKQIPRSLGDKMVDVSLARTPVELQSALGDLENLRMQGLHGQKMLGSVGAVLGGMYGPGLEIDAIEGL